ncbi:unnamed protein product [Durusdinium trenchii]|uniref:Uncharacterized protein n=1 Tax=Durusdinium trenchii TaxID=1381693 RepID=A0ABP0IZJ8_9DINO
MANPAPLDGKEDEVKSHVLTHLPGTVCTECGAKDYPLNTLFPDVNPLAVGFPDMERYLPLVLALYDVSPMGEYTVGFLEKIFANIDRECDFKLSKCRYLRDRAKWANTEAYALFAILAYSRRYWRRSMKKRTVNDIAAQLQAVMQRSPKKARHVVTKDSEAPCLVDKGLNENDGGNQVPPVEIEVWEVSDDDGEEHSPPSSNGGPDANAPSRVSNQVANHELPAEKETETETVCYQTFADDQARQPVEIEQTQRAGIDQAVPDTFLEETLCYANCTVEESQEYATAPGLETCDSSQEICMKVLQILQRENFKIREGGELHSFMEKYENTQASAALEDQPTKMSALVEDAHPGVLVSDAARPLRLRRLRPLVETSHDEDQCKRSLADQMELVAKDAGGTRWLGQSQVLERYGKSQSLEGFERIAHPDAPDSREADLYHVEETSKDHASRTAPEDNAENNWEDLVRKAKEAAPMLAQPQEEETWKDLVRRVGPKHALSVQMEREAMEVLSSQPVTAAAEGASSGTKDAKKIKKYQLPPQPSFVDDMKALAEGEEPPVYAEQGRDIGKTRGRKPKRDSGKRKPEEEDEPVAPKRAKRRTRAASRAKAVEKGSGAASSSRKRAKPSDRASAESGAKRRRPAKQAGNQVDNGSSMSPTAASSARSARNGSRAAKLPPSQPAAAGDGSSEQLPVPHGPQRKPPDHVTSNHVYSSAHSKHRHLGAEAARAAANAATRLFRETGYVDDLCGVFRSSPKIKKDDAQPESVKAKTCKAGEP